MQTEEFWIKRTQAQAYPNDLVRLNSGKEIHRSSDISSLNTKVDEKGILRVGERLEHAPIPYQAKRLAILSKKHDIVSFIWQRKLNSVLEHVLLELHQNFLVPEVRSAIMKLAKS